MCGGMPATPRDEDPSISIDEVEKTQVEGHQIPKNDNGEDAYYNNPLDNNDNTRYLSPELNSQKSLVQEQEEWD